MAVLGARQRRVNMVRHNRDDDRTPALRLPVPKCVPAVKLPGTTERLPDPATIPLLEPVTGRPLSAPVSREAAREFPESGDRERHRPTGETAQPVALRRQVAGHDQRRGQRRARRGLRRIPPERLAVYSVVIGLVLALVIIAGIQAIQGSGGPVTGESGIIFQPGP